VEKIRKHFEDEKCFDARNVYEDEARADKFNLQWNDF
jgi:hypothetical protein